MKARCEIKGGNLRQALDDIDSAGFACDVFDGMLVFDIIKDSRKSLERALTTIDELCIKAGCCFSAMVSEG
ncbi:MAG: hypothetical protein N4A36_00460 [Candidatus Gracilibacteria bacterium]|jgi:hypothetical protein|nr:hypothetical protein [Candidatus Gracilibacteria bacterium]